ncbi:MAG: HNH endonuclease, partial [Acidobacteria bacterium]|nr:HNH endonuclease [Acidobacteriota bacterium]
TRFLEVHHLTPRTRGGTNVPANLITLCSACHHLWHERGAPGPSPLP